MDDFFPSLTRLMESQLDSADDDERKKTSSVLSAVAHVNSTLHNTEGTDIISHGRDLVALAAKTAGLPTDEVRAGCLFAQPLPCTLNGETCCRTSVAQCHKAPASTASLPDVYRVAQEQCV